MEPFIHDTSVLNIWNADFFKQITEGAYRMLTKRINAALYLLKFRMEFVIFPFITVLIRSVISR